MRGTDSQQQGSGLGCGDVSGNRTNGDAAVIDGYKLGGAEIYSMEKCLLCYM